MCLSGGHLNIDISKRHKMLAMFATFDYTYKLLVAASKPYPLSSTLKDFGARALWNPNPWAGARLEYFRRATTKPC